MIDCLIVGAGAAGLAAARHMQTSGKSYLLIEARDRIGGRIYTDRTFASFPVDLGAEFIHGENASTHALIREAELGLIPVDRYGQMHWGQTEAKPLRNLPKSFQTMLKGLKESYQQLENASLPQDISLADYLSQKGWNDSAIDYADVLLAQTCCSNIYDLSCQDIKREMLNDQAGSLEFRIRGGYEALLKHFSRNLAINLSESVQRIEQNKSTLGITTNKAHYQAKTCIVTLPISLLQQGYIKFRPNISEAKQKAIKALKMEPGTKLLYSFEEPFWGDDLTYMLHTGLAARWWTPGFGQDQTSNQKKNHIICAFLTAERAKKIDAFSEEEALELGLNDLSTLLGVKRSSLKAGLLKAKRVSWAKDPWSQGAYAHAPVGAAEARLELAKPEQSLFFAGEACAYFSNPQTVHGAFDSGTFAAQEAIAFLG